MEKLKFKYEWEIPTDLCYFVQSPDGLVWKLVFKAFSGSTTGEAAFEKTPVTPNSIKDNAGNNQGFFAIEPNIIERGSSFELVYGTTGNQTSNIEIYDLSGNKVFSQNFDSSDFTAMKVSPRLSAGMYLVVMKIGGEASAQKLIVK